MKRMLKSAGVLAFLCLMTAFSARNAVAATPWLHTNGNWIQDPNGNNVTLRGVSIRSPKYFQYFNPQLKTVSQVIDMTADPAASWYTKVLRLPCSDGATDPIASYFTSYIDPYVQQCVTKGMYVIVDLHLVADYGGTTGTQQSAVLNFWNYVAPKYANTPNVIFEVYNEPINNAATGVADWTSWKAYIQPVVTAIRNVAPNNLIIMGSPSWSTMANGAVADPIAGGNIAYTEHIYPYSAACPPPATLDQKFGTAANTIPVFMTEFGFQNNFFGAANDFVTTGTLSGFGTPMKTYLEAHKNISWTAWCFDNQGWWSVMFDANWNILPNATYPNTEDFMGVYVRDWLNADQNDHQPAAGAAALTAQIAAGTAVIDGTVDAAWSNAASNAITKVTGTISSSADLSASWKGMWDTTNLYILADVTDDVKKNDSVNVYDDDAVEIFVDGGNNKTTTYDANDRQILCGWGDAGPVEGGGRTITGVTFAKADPTATTYRIEAKIPWSTLGVTAVANNSIGIDVHVDDDDDGGVRDGKLAWNDGTDMAWSNPSLFGIGILNAPIPVPSVPTGLTATAGNTQVALAWTPVSGATAYDVKRSTVSGSGYAVVSSPTSAAYTNTGLTNGTTYYFVVSAKNASGSSANSSQVSAIPVAPVQAQIAAGTAVIDGTAEAAWTPVTSYSITKISGTVSSGADLSASWKGMWDATNLYILVDVTDDVKINDSVNTYDDDAVEIFVDGGNNKTTTYDANDRQVVCGWGDAAAVEGQGRSITGVTFAKADPTSTTYRIEAKIPWSTLGVTAAANNLIGIDVHVDDDDDGGVRDGKIAWNDGTDMAWSNPSLFGTGKLLAGGSAPAAPTGLVAVAGNAQVALSWNASSGATAYDVKRSTVSGSGYVTVSSPTTTSYTNTGLTNGTVYYFVVAAKNAVGSSANSAQVSATPVAPPTNTHSGTWAAKGIFSGTPSHNALYQDTVSVVANTNYVATFWLKGTGVVSLYVYQGSWGTQVGTLFCTATSTWQQFSVAVNTGANTLMTFNLQDDSTTAGTVYVDDAFLGVSGGANKLGNPGFESGNVTWGKGAAWSILQNP